MKLCLIHSADHWYFERPLLKHRPRIRMGAQEWTGGPESGTVLPPWKLYFNPWQRQRQQQQQGHNFRDSSGHILERHYETYHCLSQKFISVSKYELQLNTLGSCTQAMLMAYSNPACTVLNHWDHPTAGTSLKFLSLWMCSCYSSLLIIAYELSYDYRLWKEKRHYVI